MRSFRMSTERMVRNKKPQAVDLVITVQFPVAVRSGDRSEVG